MIRVGIVGGKTCMIGTILAEYRILEDLGGQAGTEVYKAIGFDSRKPVVIKLFPSDLSRDKDKLQALLDALRKVARLDQPGIPRLIGSGLTGGRAYLIMPFMTGGNLRERLEMGQISPADAGAVLDKVAAVLERIHALSMVHGHLSPSEVMFDDTGNLQIIGLGQAAFVLNGSNGPAKTAELEYLAPEVRSGGPATPASDQFSMAVLALELLTGQRVHPRLEASPHANSKLGAFFALDIQVAEVIRRALENDPSKRFESVSEMARALDKAIRSHGSQPRVPRASPVTRQVSPRVHRSLGWGMASMAAVAFGCFALTVPTMAAASWMGVDIRSIADFFSARLQAPTRTAAPVRSTVILPKLPSLISTPTLADQPQGMLPTPGRNGDPPEPTETKPSIPNDNPDQTAPTKSPTSPDDGMGQGTESAPQPGSTWTYPSPATPTAAASNTSYPNGGQHSSPTPVPPQPTATGQSGGTGGCSDPAGQGQGCTATPAAP